MRLRDILVTDAEDVVAINRLPGDPAGSHGARTDSIWRFSLKRTRASVCLVAQVGGTKNGIANFT
jgi:hypothetical protein